MAVAAVLATALWFVASSQGGDAGRRLPVGGGHVTKVSPTEVRVAFATAMPWQWNMWIVKRPSLTSTDRVCLMVDLLGPLGPVRNGLVVQGPEVAHKGCGPIDPSRGVVVASPNGGGSVEFPSGITESWKAFDIGIAVYQPSVDRVRLVFSGGGSEVLRTRALPNAVAFKNAEPFRYVVFAGRGCVSEVEGLEKGRAVAHVGPRDCSGSPE